MNTTGDGALQRANLSGTDGPDTLPGTASDDQIFGRGGNDLIRGGEGSDRLFGEDGSDTLQGGEGFDLLDGGPGADVLEGGPGQDGYKLDDFYLPGRDTIIIKLGDSSAAGGFDFVEGWTRDDRISFAATPGALATFTATSRDAGVAQANALIAGGARYVAMQLDDPNHRVASQLYIFCDSANDGGTAEDVVTILGGTLADFSAVNVGATSSTGPTAPPDSPAPAVTIGAQGSVHGNMDTVHVGALLGADIDEAESYGLILDGPNAKVVLGGNDLTYDSKDLLTGGSINIFKFAAAGFEADLLFVSAPVSVTPFQRWVATDATGEALTTLLAGNDRLTGTFSAADLMRGFGGDDRLVGEGGADSIFGGTGDDTIYAGLDSTSATTPSAAATYLRGEEGNDYILGQRGFDDINGNQGNDTASGGDGEDWVVGGKDNDVLFGDAAYDLVYGNLGNDTCEGGDGNDIVRGGQDNDVVRGGAGDDFVSGDKGDDTMSGGAGADVFHTFGEANIDRVTDFNRAEGDRVQVDPGTTYTVSQAGADTVISMTGGGQMILVGVSVASLTGAWIFGA